MTLPTLFPAVLAFTLIEFIIVLVIVGFLVFLGINIARSVRRSARVTGRFVNPPATVPAGGSAGFTFQVTQLVGGGSPMAVAGRVVRFTVTPAALSVSPAQATTSGDGLIQVTVSAPEDYRGPGTLMDTDVVSGAQGTPVTFTVE
ncbi:MAG: type II secretion system protein [Verrucomicrobiales bacterium]|nr:type II secretion system protein [Verrucomicrobiales bacterium]